MAPHAILEWHKRIGRCGSGHDRHGLIERYNPSIGEIGLSRCVGGRHHRICTGRARHTYSFIAALSVRRRPLESDRVNMSDPRAWFQAKAVGIGWTPRTWEGWAVIAALIAVGALVGRLGA